MLSDVDTSAETMKNTRSQAEKYPELKTEVKSEGQQPRTRQVKQNVAIDTK